MSEEAFRLERVLERPDLETFELPARLSAGYGGDLGIASPRVYANFVSSVDGTVALSRRGESGRVISGGSKPDRFVMGLLRAFADAVLIGAGTYRQTPRALWNSAHIAPDFAAEFAELRRRLDLRPQPRLVIVSGSGNLEPGPALEQATVVTTRSGEAALRAVLPASAKLVVFGGERVDVSDVMRLLREEPFERVLTEGGPTLLGELVSAGFLEELFLTISPQLFGRAAGDGKKSLVDGVDLSGTQLELQSLRRHASHLFLRYAVGARVATNNEPPAGAA